MKKLPSLPILLLLVIGLLAAGGVEATRYVPEALNPLTSPRLPSFELTPEEEPARPFALFAEADYPVLAILATLSPEDAVRVANRNHLRLFPALGPLSDEAEIELTRRIASGFFTSLTTHKLQKGEYLSTESWWTGNYYAKARFYDPEIGRFLSEDPVWGDASNPPSLHRYLYAYGNPTYYTDPDGQIAAIKWLQDKFTGASEGAQELTQMYTETEFSQTAGGKAVGVGVGVLSGIAQFSTELVGMGVGAVNMAANTAVLTVSDESDLALEAAGEIESAYYSTKQTIAVVAEDPVGVGATIVKGAADTVVGIAQLDPNSIASGTKFAADIALGKKGLGSGAKTVKAMRKARSIDRPDVDLGRVRRQLDEVAGSEYLDDGLRTADQPLGGSAGISGTAKRRFDATGLSDDQVEKAILKSIRRKSGAKGTSSGQVAASADQTEFILRNVTEWRSKLKAADPTLADVSAGLKGTIVHSSVAKRIRQLDIAGLDVNRRMYGDSLNISPATGLPYEYRIPDYKLGDTIFDIKPAGTPLSGPQVDDFMSFANTTDVRFIYYDQW